MKQMRFKKVVSACLALLLSLSTGSVFALACTHSKGGSDLVCLRACKHGSDLLTQNGRLPGLASTVCVSASLAEQAMGTLVNAAKLSAPQVMSNVALAPTPALALTLVQVTALLRAPPIPTILQAVRSIPLGLAPPQA